MNDQPLAATITSQFTVADLAPGTRVAGRFRIVRLLGIGAMGLVYEAFDEQLDVRVALKVLRPELARRPEAFARFRQELLLARQVSSPHVVRIHDLVQHGDTWMISMEFIPGRSLEARIREGAPLPLEEALRIVRQLALGLAAAHARGVVHRDLKPANVLLDDDGNAYISDFGVARAAGATRLTGTGMVVGTPDYLSPEQALAEPLDGRSDQYALGLILREMLTGKLPFSGGTGAENLTQRIINEVPSLQIERPDLPPWVIALADRLLRRRAVHRFEDTAEIARVIEEARMAPAPIESRRWRLHLAVAALVLAVAIGSGIAFWRWRDGETQQAVPVAIAPSVAVAVLPFVADTEDAQEFASRLADGLTDALQMQLDVGVADRERVARALSVLGFDARNVGAHLDQVASELGAERLVQGRVESGSEGLRVVISVQRRGASGPEWSMSSPPMPSATELGALTEWLASVLARLGGGSTIDPTVFEAGAAWRELAALEASARSLDARSRARALLDGPARAKSTAWQRVRGYAALLVGEPSTAVTLLTPLAAAHRSDHPARLVLARALAEQGQFDRAVNDLQQLVAEDERNVEAWFLLGKFAIMRGDARTAVDEYLVRAMLLAKRLGDRRWRAEVANAFGVGYRNLGRMAEAAEEYEVAIRARHELGDARGEAVSRRNLAVALAFLGRHDEAREQLQQARRLLEPIGDAAALADVANDAGVLAEERGDVREALERYREALGLRQTQGDPRLIGESLINVGFAYFQMGEFDNALVYLRQANQTYADIDDASGAVRAKQSLALAEIARGNLNEARRLLEDSLHRAEASQMAEERAVALVTLADLARLEGRYPDALAQVVRARELFESLKDRRGRVEAELVRVQCLIESGDLTAAQAALTDLPESEIANLEQQAMRAQRLAELRLRLDDPNGARAAAESAVRFADEAHSQAQAVAGRILLAEAQSALGRRVEARRTLEEARKAMAAFASASLRLRLLEAELRVVPERATVSYREARGELARWPAYGRARLLHRVAADALLGRDEELARQAKAAAEGTSEIAEPSS